MHPALIEAHALMLPRLQAEEDMRAVRNLALGTGRMQREDARRAQAELRRQAEGGRRAPARPARPDELMAAGVGVRRAPRRTASDG
ncbi:MAG: hypothetical protein RIB67_07465 [Miltoncostaeaceae bacterium]